MKVKDLALTFVAMGGFAVPIQFQLNANAAPSAPQSEPSALIGQVVDNEPAKTGKR